MLQLTRVRGSDSEINTEFRLVAMGFLGQAPSAGGPGLAASYAVPAGVGATINSDFIQVAGFITFRLTAGVVGAVQLKIVTFEPQLLAANFTELIGVMTSNVPISFGARSLPAAMTDGVFGVIQLQFSNNQAGASTINVPRFYASAG